MFIEFHPGMVQFAVALLIASVVLDTIGVALTRDSFIMAGFFNLVGGAAFAVLGVVSGFLAKASLPARPPAGMSLLALHEVVTFAGVLGFLGLAVWRGLMRGRVPLRGRSFYLAVGFTCALVLITGAVIGGVMVYRHGLGVAPSLLKPELLKP